MKIIFVSLISLIVTVLFYLFWWTSPLIRQLDYKIYDRLNTSFPSSHRPHSTVIVEIDDKSLKAFGQWPWPRVITAELITTISNTKPANIALDVIFSENDRASPDTLQKFYQTFFDLKVNIEGVPKYLQNNDRILSNVIARSTTVLPVFSDRSMEVKECVIPSSIFSKEGMEFEELPYLEALVCSLPMYQNNANAIGHIHALADEDGTLRRLSMLVHYRDKLIPTLGLASIGSLTAPIQVYPESPFLGSIGIHTGKHHIASDSDGTSLLTFYPEMAYEKISAYDLLNGTYDPKRLEGKFVFIGTTALGLDTWHTLSNGTILPGVFVHATMVENILNDDLRVQPSLYPPINITLSFLISLILWVLMGRKKYLSVLFTFFAALSVAGILSILTWQQDIYISIGYFLIPLISHLFVLALLMFLIDYRDQKRYIEEIERASEQRRRLKNDLDRSETEIEYQKAMLFQQSKLAAMGEMIDNIAHQWRQPLNTLGVNVQDVAYAFKSGRIDSHYIRTMTSESMEQIGFMSQTIEDFRNFVKPDQTNTLFDLNQAVVESLQLLSGMFESYNITIDVDYSEEDLVIYGSTSEVKQVLINLLSNARDALVEHQPVDPLITIRIFEEGEYGAITVQDNGGGVSLSVIERIFEPYFTTKEEGKGSGIGLYMSYSIIRTKMKGNIEVANVEGGTLFTIMVPLAKEAFLDE